MTIFRGYYNLKIIKKRINFDSYAAAATDAGMTSYHAVVIKGNIKPGMKVGIIGIGGLGQVGARIAVLKGCEVYASSRKPEARQRAMDLGCKDTVETALELAQFNLDVIIDFAGSGDTTYNALEAVGHKGRVVVAGMAKLEAPINTMTLKQGGVNGRLVAMMNR